VELFLAGALRPNAAANSLRSGQILFPYFYGIGLLPGTDLPMKIAIIICTHKRPGPLERLLRSLQQIQTGNQDPDDFGIILVDNHPDGRARLVCERAAAKLPIKIKFVEEQQQGGAYAKNRAVDEALKNKPEFLAFIDDDDIPEPDWLLHLIEKQRQTKADIVCGTFPPVIKNEWPDWFRKSPLFDPPSKKPIVKHGIPSGIGSGNTLIKRQILDRLKRIGPVFSPRYPFLYDGDFFIRAHNIGAKFAIAEKSVIHRYFDDYRVTVRGLLRYAFRLGEYTMQLLADHGLGGKINRRKSKAIKNIVLRGLSLPVCIFSPVQMVRNLFKISKEMGILFFYYCRQ
jgi:glycosyltransferase involved in cell wall biosynthesis